MYLDKKAHTHIYQGQNRAYAQDANNPTVSCPLVFPQESYEGQILLSWSNFCPLLERVFTVHFIFLCP